jgi:ABC-type branched-subunit amino acid transport system permease subunit
VDVGTLTQQLVNALTLGAIYALIALGYTMVYGIIELINFAHGDVFMVGSFVSLWLLTISAQPPRAHPRPCPAGRRAGRRVPLVDDRHGTVGVWSSSDSPTGRCATRPGWRR